MFAQHVLLLLLLLFVLTSRWHVIVAAGGRRHRPGARPDDTGVGDTMAVAADARSVKSDDDGSDNKHFMDAYTLQSGPRQLEFGHVFEDANVWEQRYEKKDFDGHRYQGKVKWGDKDGGYGEQYWDLNHGETAPEEERVPDETPWSRDTAAFVPSPEDETRPRHERRRQKRTKSLATF